MSNKKSIIILTGPPGVGKTTLLQSICKDLQIVHKIALQGFYTEEVRTAGNGPRIGFEVVTMDGKRGVLASEHTCHGEHRPKVGRYAVHVAEFENIVLPLLRTANTNQLLVVDEIGRMELKSRKFEMAVQELIPKVPIFATVPFQTQRPIPIVEQIKSSQHSKVFEITKANRNDMQNIIIEALLQSIK